MFYFTFLFLVSAYFINEKYDKEIPIGYLAMPFFVINIIKYGAGTDYFSYSKIYDQIAGYDFLTTLSRMPQIDIGFKLLTYLAQTLGMNFVVYSAIVMSFISYYAIKWIVDESENVYISLLLFFSMFYLYWNLSVMRQSIALVFLTYIFFNNRRNFSSKAKIISTLLMVTFHKSALVIPAFYLISKLNWTRNKFIIVLLLAPLSRVFSLNIVVEILGRVPLLTRVLKYLDYNSISYLSIPSMQRLFFVVVLLIFYNQLSEKPKTKLLVNYAIANLILYFYLPTSMVIGTRTTIFGYYTLIVLLPAIISLFDTRQLKTISFVGVTLMSSVYLKNELDKQKKNSHYNQSIHKMNFETILNKNLDHYSNAYAVDYAVEKTNDALNKSSDIYDKVINEKYTTTTDDVTPMISVKFPNRKDFNFGVVNTQGEVILEPIFESRLTMVGPYIETYNDEKFVKNYTYSHILKPNLAVPFEDVVMTLNQEALNKSFLISNDIIERELEPKDLDQFEFLEMYDVSAILETEWYYFENMESYSYIRLATKYSSYYMILIDDVPVVDKLYTRITPLNEKGIIMGYTHTGIDYINQDGEVFWFEER